ncbi:MAG TPA: glycosyltransferase [Longimicrobiales bacterium]|nr:glycosyltransferase [Longimicrobiales bacterium]
MNVAVYYPWVYLTSGAERTLTYLTGESRHTWTIFTHRYDADSTFPELRDRNIVQLGRVSVRRTFSGVLRAGARIATDRLPLEDYDALVVLCEGVGDLVVFRNRDVPTLCICLTPLRIAFDSSYAERWARGRSAFERAILAAGTAVFRVVDRRAWKRYDRVICISEETRRRARAGGLRARSAMEVVPVGLGFEPDATASIAGDYFLLPGRIMWTKNVELAIEAFLLARRASGAMSRFRLIIAGMVDEKSRPYLERLRRIATDAPVEFCIAPADAELAELYRNCYAVLFPAFNEDWGIVPLEAMAFGKPVIATDQGGPRETVVDGVTGFLEPPVPSRFGARMRQLASNPQLSARLGAAGPERARNFTWSRFVDRVDRALEDSVRTPAPEHVTRTSASRGVKVGAS